MGAIASCDSSTHTPEAARWAAHQDVLLSRALRLCGDADTARDLVQETFVRALSCEARFAPGTNSAAWLSTILRRLFIDDWRRRQRVTYVALTEVEEPTDERCEPDARWAHVSASELQAAVESLGPTFRAVFQLHAVERLSYREISAHLGIPTATVGTRLARARQKLKKVLLTGGAQRPARYAASTSA